MNYSMVSLIGEMKMKMISAILLATLTAAGSAQLPLGKWHDVSKDVNSHFFLITSGTSDGSPHVLIAEDYEVVQTHEICGTVYGYFMEKSNEGRYDVNFKGMRTSATFTFTTQYDAERWVQKFCTPDSLLSIRKGDGATLVRKY
jgi:hypothetical protein